MVREGHAWTNKPPLGTPLDPGHPLARELVTEFVPYGAGNFVDRLGTTYTWTDANPPTRTLEGGRTGTAVRTGASHAYCESATLARPISGTAVTIAFIAKSYNDTGVIWEDAADQGNEIVYRFGGTIEWRWGYGSSGDRLTWTPPAGFFNTAHAIVCRAGSLGMELWSDGVRVASSTTAVTTFGGSTSTMRIGVGNFVTGLWCDAAIEGLWVWRRQLPGAEIVAWTASPYSMYAAPATRRLLSTIPRARVSQAGAVAIGQGTPRARISQAGAVAIGQGTPKARISQVGLVLIGVAGGAVVVPVGCPIDDALPLCFEG